MKARWANSILILCGLALSLSATASPQAKAQPKTQPKVQRNTQNELSKAIQSQGLGKYEKVGQIVKKSVKNLFVQEMDRPDVWTISPVETWDEAYTEKLKPGTFREMLDGQERHQDVELLFAEVNRALALKGRFQNTYRTNPAVRARIQNILIGLLHVIDGKIRIQMDSSLDEIIRLRRFLLTQGTFYATGKMARLRLDDLWWDLLWLRGYTYSQDLVELHLEKVSAIASVQNFQWKSRLDRYFVSLSMMVLRKNPSNVMIREKPFIVSIRLAQKASEKAEQMQVPQNVSKELKLDLYKYLTQAGQTYEARQLRKEIAMDLFFEKGQDIYTKSLAPWENQKMDLIEKVKLSVYRFVENVLVFVTYGVGFVFLATPIELILIFIGLLILAHQGHGFFGTQRKSVKTIVRTHRIFGKKGFKKLPRFMKDFLELAHEEIKTAWKMFVASYTSPGVPFYSKIAASLLMFGVGLYFNSARTMVETVMNHMAMLN